MRKAFGRLVSLLLRLAPWYKPEEIEARERWTEASRRSSVIARIRAESVLADKRVRR